VGSGEQVTNVSVERQRGTGENRTRLRNVPRHYNSGQGRFMSADLMSGNIRSPQSLNKYSYTGNDPINGVDPLGLDTLCATPFITTEWSDGHKTTISGVPVCVFWDPFFVGVAGTAPSPLGGVGPKVPVNLKALADCIRKMFNIALVSFQAVSNDAAGIFVGQTQDGQQFSFATDGTSFTSKDLSRISTINGGPEVTGLTIDGFTKTRGTKSIFLWGATFSYQTNYVGSELTSGEMFANQIHELSHQLDKKTGGPDLGTPESETDAHKFEQCYASTSSGKTK